MADSPLDPNTDLVTIDVKVDGVGIDSHRIFQIYVDSEINRVPRTIIKIIDGAPHDADQGWDAMSKYKIKISSEIIISAGYHSENEQIFKGIVTGITHKVETSEHSYTMVECLDKAVVMTLTRNYALYKDKKDSDIVSAIIGNHAGLSKEIDATSVTHKFMIQNGVTDWDFIVTRAEVSERLIVAEGGKIYFDSYKHAGTPELTLTYGADVIGMDIHINSRFQQKEMRIGSWNPASQNKTASTQGDPNITELGNQTGKKMSTSLKFKENYFNVSSPLPKPELDSWGKSSMVKSRLAKISGTVKFQGNHKAKPNAILEIKGMGTEFNGNAFIHRVEHILEDGNWITIGHIGLADSRPYIEQRDYDFTHKSGDSLLPGIQGLAIGKVKKIDADPDGEFRVEVSIPSINENESLWARLSKFYASDQYGSFFYPEIDDEVILGFINGDPRFPIILGSLYSRKHEPNWNPNDNNSIKGIKSRYGFIWEMDEENKTFTIETPGGIKLVFNDKDKEIKLEDSHLNKMIFDSKGIKFSTIKDFVAEAKSKINLSGDMGADLKSSAGALNASGMNVKINGQIKTAVSGVQLELAGNAMASLRGGLVKIN